MHGRTLSNAFCHQSAVTHNSVSLIQKQQQEDSWCDQIIIFDANLEACCPFTEAAATKIIYWS